MKNRLQLTLPAILVSTALTANAGISIVDNESGNFSIGGNVELNFNYQDRDSVDSSEFNQDGRVLIEFEGEKYAANGHYVGVKAQPLFESTGNIALDDAYFVFGKQDAWSIKAGRFEGYDMFPVGLDVFLEYSGDTANDLYNGESAYVYQMKEARGRGSDGQIIYSQSFGDLYLELGAMIGDRSNLFADTYHGVAVDHDATKDSFLIRPVVAYSMGDFTLSAAMETNLVSNAIVDENGKDISDRTGYGVTGNWSQGEWSLNANFAYLDAVDETNQSIGVNALYGQFGVGYIHASNEYDSAWAKGDVAVNTGYASYEFTNVLEVEEFSVLLGTYYTTLDNKTDNASVFAEDDDFGARIRLFYEF